MKNLYTPLEEVKAILAARRNDTALLKRVEEFLGPKLPEPLIQGNKAVLVRCIASPDNEFFHFHDLAAKAGLDPLLIEYPEDKFVARNSDKYALCKLHFYKEGMERFEEAKKISLINFNTQEGKKFKDIITINGSSLVSFHHDLLQKSAGGTVEVFDFSDYFFSTRFQSEYYYLYYLGLFLCHGVLFENMLMSEEEREFTLTKVVPSFEKLESMFGIRPLIVPVTPVDSEDDFLWWTYPERTEAMVEEMLSSGR